MKYNLNRIELCTEVVMWSKLFKGERPLIETFWKFGVLGLIILKFITKCFGSLLSSYLQGRTIYNFFLHHFNPLTSSKLSIFWTLCYISSLLILAMYSWNIMVAVWKSSANYDKSEILRFLARISIVLMIIFIWHSVFFKVIS